jgi:AcrR family transcriptional regulator
MLMNKSRGRGRPRGTTHTREQILQSARQMFLASGYRRVSMRAIATAAGVDVALISYYFGSKRGLFAAVMQLAVSPPEVLRYSLRGDPSRLPERIIADVIATWDDPERGAPLAALYHSAGSDPAASRLLRELIEREVVAVIAEHLGGADASARAGIVASQIAGLIFMRYVLRAEPLATMPTDQLVSYAAPAVRAALSARHAPGHTYQALVTRSRQRDEFLRRP